MTVRPGRRLHPLDAGFALAATCVVYAIVLLIGLATLPSPQHPIQDPWFTAMEALILVIAPLLVVFAAALHADAPRDAQGRRLAGVLAVAFMAACAVVTCSVHFAVLTLSRQPAFAVAPWSPLVFGFRWPSVVYALDILAWDVFFALGALASALTLDRERPALRRARALMLASAVLAFAGLAGVALADMTVRNLGIVGYVLLFPSAAVGVAALRRRD